MKISEFWQGFKKEYAIETDSYAAYAFGVDEDELAQLVLSGKKTATSSLYLAYEFENEPLPQVGAYNMILDSQEQPVCITQTKQVYLYPFNEITAEFAKKEGEGDLSLHYWQVVHEAFFQSVCHEMGTKFSSEMLVVCEEFVCLYPKSFPR